MKKLFLLSVIILFSVYARNLFAESMPVQVFSSSYSISGSIGCISGTCYSNSYNESGTMPLSNSIMNSGGWEWASAGSAVGFFYVDAQAGAGLYGKGIAYAEAEWIFQPLSSMDHLTIYNDRYMGGYWASSSAELIDLTDASTIWSKYYWDGGASDLILHSFQMNHVYRLYFQVGANANADQWTPYIYTNDMIAVVPEYTTALLLGLGLIGLAGVRRKFRY